MPMDEDLDVFFDDDEFAQTATLNGTAAGNVIVDREYLRALGMVDSTNPQALAQAAEYGTAVIEGTLVTGGVTYVVRNRQLQGDGACVLLDLEAQ